MGAKCIYKLDVHQSKSLKECDREAIKNGLCICHVRDSEKDIELLYEEFEKELLGDGPSNFIGFFFPPSFYPRLCDRTFEKAVVFDFAVFANDPSGIHGPCFNGSIFLQDVSFKHTRFMGKVWFSASKFHGIASFQGAESGDWQLPFVGAIFYQDVFFGRETGNIDTMGAEFNARVSFAHAEFKRNVNFSFTKFNGGVDFEEAKFRGDNDATVTFSRVSVKNASTEVFPEGKLEFFRTLFMTPTVIDMDTCRLAELRFTGCNVQRMAFSFLNLSDRKVSFVEDTYWPAVNSVGDRVRFEIIEEEYLESRRSKVGSFTINPVRVVNAYRQLEEFFYSKSDYTKACDCYIGSMICRRHDPTYSRTHRVLNHFYEILGNYGMSVSRPLVWLTIMFVLAPLFLVCWGIKVNDLLISNHRQYWEIFISNIGLVLFAGRFNYAQPTTATSWAIIIIETLLTICLVAFIIIASRRKFTPKKPLSEN